MLSLGDWRDDVVIINKEGKRKNWFGFKRSFY